MLHGTPLRYGVNHAVRLKVVAGHLERVRRWSITMPTAST